MRLYQAQNFFYNSKEAPSIHKLIRRTDFNDVNQQQSPADLGNVRTQSPHILHFQRKKQVYQIKQALRKFNQTIKEQQIRLFGLQLKQKRNESKSVKNLGSTSKSKMQIEDTSQQQGAPQSKLKISNFERYYLSSCYLLFQWKLVKPAQIDTQLQKIVDSVGSNQISNIRIVGSQLKFDKFNKSLVYNNKKGNRGQWIQEKLIYEMDTVQRQQYSYKNKTLSIQNGSTYTYDSDIQQVQNREDFFAVRTLNQVCISFNEINKSFKIKSSFIKWGAKGLYVFAQDGKIILIQRQKYFTKKLNEFNVEQGQLGSWSKQDFLVPCGDQMIHGTFLEKGYLFLRVIGGQSIRVQLGFKQESSSIIFSGGFSYGNKVTIIVLAGKELRIEQMHEYQFKYV